MRSDPPRLPHTTSRARRAARWLLLALAVPSLLMLLVTLLLWRRSLYALDQFSGGLGFTRFTFDAYAGRIEGVVNRPYRVRRDGKLARLGPGDPRPRWGELELHDDPNYRSDYVGRQRWPIGITTRWPVESLYFPAPAADVWLAWAREGPGRYDGCVSVTVPYWLVTLAFAIAPTLATASIVRRQRRALRPHACTACGYDCRASPDRCPECGTPRAAS